MSLSLGKKLRPLQLATIIFLTVSGGPYGLESLLSDVGKNEALVLLMITPFLWDVPTILTVLELNSMMPVTGGYYQWVKKALGLRWGFYEGWWTWLYTFTDLAIYPILFVEYASFFYPEISHYKIPVCLVIIWFGAMLNIRGIVPIGRASLLLSAAVLIPFLILFIYAMLHHSGFNGFPPLSLKNMKFSSTGVALYTIMWNFIGWDNVTTYAEEVKRPVRSYIISIAIAFCSIYIVYLLAIFVAGWSGIDVNYFSQNGFPALGSFIAGKWLGVLLAIGGMASTLGLFSAVLLSVSRIPEVMSEDKLLPARLHALHPRFGTPYISIILCALVVSCMIWWDFAELLIIDVTLYGAGLLLEFISLIVFRYKAADVHRPFRIPLNTAGLCVIILIPVAILGIALGAAFASTASAFKPVLFTSIALLSAEIAWRIIGIFRPIR